MRRLASALVVLVLAAASSARALDPGVASGHFAGDGAKLGFTHAVALSQDNTEGLLDHGPQIRLLLSQEDVPPDALYGIAFPPVRQMAQAGAVHGVLLEFSPTDKTTLYITVLSPPTEAGAFMHTLTLSSSNGVWKQLEVTATRASGGYDAGGDPDLAFTFSAPVFSDPVQADLKGADAQASEPMKVLIARAQAIGRGDLPAALALSAKGSRLRDIPPAALKQFAGEAAGMVKQFRAVKRVVVRRDTAVALLDAHSWANLVREDGAWKVAD
jgi:hypothetical protein